MRLGRIGPIAVVLLAVATMANSEETVNSASGKAFPSKDQVVIPVALWEEDGKPMVVRGAEAVNAAPSDAVHVTATVFGATGVREIAVPAGSKFLPLKGPHDTVVYLAKGRMTATLGDSVTEILPGDVFQKSGSAYNLYEFHEDSILIEHYVDSP